ncbi:MAG: hypothetical protein KatS3mg129_2232 [Leptospiraceae bacterium]|nr:MAG: hypothetical protein KatS3mg129_2232 [Leptospiraceae bacterium]
MPKEISHIYFAEEIQKDLRPEIQQILKQNQNLYYYGSTSPDLFYYYLPLRKQFHQIGRIDWGKYIHDHKENMNPIYLLLEWEKENLYSQSKKIFSFVAGYLTHVAADTIFHPYIYSITGHYYNPDKKLQKIAQRNHRIFESKMDLFIIENIYKTNLKQFQLLQKLSLRDEEKEIINLYGIAIKESFSSDSNFNNNLMSEFTLFCYNNQMNLIKLFQSKQLLFLLSLLRYIHFEIDNTLCLCYSNHLKEYSIDFYHFEPAPHPITGETIEGNFFTFTEKIKSRGVLLIESAYDYLMNPQLNRKFLEKQIPHYSLNTGLIQIPNDRMQYFKLHPAFSY